MQDRQMPRGTSGVGSLRSLCLGSSRAPERFELPTLWFKAKVVRER
jgi:hypothetical protein